VFITRNKTVGSVRSISEYSRTLFFLQSKNPFSSRCKHTFFLCMGVFKSYYKLGVNLNCCGVLTYFSIVWF